VLKPVDKINTSSNSVSRHINLSPKPGNLLEDIEFSSNKIKDFKQAYQILASKLINKGSEDQNAKLKSNLLITQQSIQTYLDK
jgi:hypothetical protein